MNEKKVDFQTALKRSLSHAPADADGGDHPDVERWIAYAYGQVSEAEREQLQEHLLDCRECIDLVLDLEAFQQASAPAPAAVSEFEVAKVRSQVRAAISQEHAAAAAAPAIAPPAARRRSYWPHLAAAALVAALATGLLQQVQIRELSQPRLDVATVTLMENAAHRGDEAGNEVLELAGEDSPAIVYLVTRNPLGDGPCELELLGPDDRTLWRRSFSPAPGQRQVNLDLPGGFLATGDYRLRLSGAGGALLEEFPLRVRVRPR